MIKTQDSPTVHKHVGGSTGGPGECGAWCLCGVRFDGFDTAAEASEQLDLHIADEERRGRVMATDESLAVELADGLRALAGMIEDNPSVADRFKYALNINVFPEDEQEMATLVRATLRHNAKVSKRPTGDWMIASAAWGRVTVDIAVKREEVCERVATGTETVTRTVPDPSVVVPMVEVTETVPVYEWICRPLLAAEGGESS